MTYFPQQFLYGILCIVASLQLLHAASLPLQEFEELITSGVRHTGLLAGTPDVSHLPHGAYPHVFESEQHLPDSYYHAGDTSLLDTFFNNDRNIWDQSDVTAYGHIQTPPPPLIPISEPRSSNLYLSSANDHLQGSNPRIIQSPEFQSLEKPTNTISTQLQSTSLGGGTPQLSHVPLEPLEQQHFFDLSPARRQLVLAEVQNDLLRTIGARRFRSTRDPVLEPYKSHLTQDNFAKAIQISSRTGGPPWIWRSGGHRFLLRQASPNSKWFELLNGFRTSDTHLLYFEVWLEKGQSELFEYLGVIRLPNRRTLNPFKKNVLAKSLVSIQYTIVSPSTIATKGIEHK